jgi:hypothetical protein
MAVLTKKQTIALDTLEQMKVKEMLFGGSAGGGKSWFGCYWMLKNVLRYEGSRGLIGRSKLKTLKETTLNTFFEVCQMQGLKADVHYKYNSTDSIIKFRNGSEIHLKDLFAYPSDPNFDSLGSSEYTFAFVDEANQITKKAKDVLKSRLRFKLTEFGLIPQILMTCNPAKNWTYQEFYKPDREGELPSNRVFIHSLATDNPHLSEHYIETLKELDEPSKQRLLYGNWDYDNSPDRMIDFDSIVNMFRKQTPDDLSGSGYISIDVARMGKDKTVIMRWRGWNVVEIVEIAKSGLDEIKRVAEGIALKNQIPLRNIILDEDGVGGGLKDFWRGGVKGFVNNSRALKGGNYANLKTQCAYMFAAKVNKGEVTICDTSARDLIIEELEWLRTFKMDSDTKLQIMPKEKVKQNIGRSPDYSDALIMRVWFELGKGSGRYAIR